MRAGACIQERWILSVRGMGRRHTKAGIAFWSETLGPGVSLENTKDTRFIDRPARDAASGGWR